MSPCYRNLLVPVLLASLPMAAEAAPKPVVAVFDVDCGKRVKLPAEALDGLAGYIASKLTESGNYQVVPRDQLRKRLAAQKSKSYKACVDQSCQIEIGREMAAEKTLATRIVKLGKRCTVTLTLYDLKKATTEAASTQRGQCDEDSVVESVETAITKLIGKGPEAKASPVKPALEKGALDWIQSASAGTQFTRSEVTVAQYQACFDENQCQKPDSGGSCNWGKPGRDRHPVNCIDWKKAAAFCAWAGGRLPTDQEWTAEATDNGSRKNPWGDQAPNCQNAIVKSGCGKDGTWPVCSKPAGNSVSGLCDMIGNVREWTDTAHKNNTRGQRGGDWLMNVGLEDVRADGVGTDYETGKDMLTGFRCVRQAPK